jgi:hypothetical protein
MLWSATHSDRAAWTSPAPNSPPGLSRALAIAAGRHSCGPGTGATATRLTGRATLTCIHRHPRRPPRPDDGCLHCGLGCLRCGRGCPHGAGSRGH